MDGFNKIIQSLQPKTILDVGCGGLLGENTTVYLVEKFGDSKVLGICRDNQQTGMFRNRFPNLKIITGDFYSHKFEQKFDLIVLDLNADNNFKDWSHDQLQKVREMLNDGGVIINYVMGTIWYDSEEFAKQIANHWLNWWDTDEINRETIERRLKRLQDFKILAIEQEARRPYIWWVAIQKL